MAMRRAIHYFWLILFLFSCQIQELDRFILDANAVLLFMRYSDNGSIERRVSTIVLTVDKQSFQVLRKDETIQLTTNPPYLPIYYTVDGTVPTVSSLRYSGSFAPNREFITKTIKAKSILSTGIASNLLELRYLYPSLSTGQTNCYRFSDNTLEPCDFTHTDQDGRLQKGSVQQISEPTTRFGFPNDYISHDEVFGNTWTTCRIGLSGNTCTGTLTEVTGELTNPDDLCSQLNTANAGSGFSGIQNWRLPAPLELSQISNYQLSPNIRYNEAAFPNFNTINTTLHSTRNLSVALNRFYLNINSRFFGSQADTSPRATICVSGDTIPIPVYLDLGDGTFRDELRGLIWTKCLAGQTFPNCTGVPVARIFSEAIDYCKNLTHSGRTWRLPNMNELVSLVNPSEPLALKLFAKDLFTTAMPGKVLRSSTSESAMSARRLSPDSPTNSTGGAAASKADATVHNICVSDEVW